MGDAADDIYDRYVVGYEDEYILNRRKKLSQITGTVDKAYAKALVISGVRYGANFNPEYLEGVEEGDQVQLTYETKGDWNNIKSKVSILGKGGNIGGGSSNSSTGKSGSRSSSAPDPMLLTEAPSRHYGTSRGYLNLIKTFPVAKDHPDRAIIRQNATSQATSLVVSTMSKTSDLLDATEEVIRLSRVLEQYTTGELDADEAQAALRALGETQ